MVEMFRSRIDHSAPPLHRSRMIIDRYRWRLRLRRLQRQGRSRVALASFPRSGNTWFRFLLEAATGEVTGAAGNNQPGRVLPRRGEGIVIKTHFMDCHRYTHGIHLVRNPFDVLDSFYEWKRSLGWDWKYGELSWNEFVDIFAGRWKKHTRHWLDASCEIHRVRYEYCHRDPTTHFSKLLAWLGLSVSNEKLVQAIAATTFDNLKKTQTAESAFGAAFFRRGQVNRGIERFSDSQRRAIIERLRPELMACGYHDLIERIERGQT
jgi:hypothetical protein